MSKKTGRPPLPKGQSKDLQIGVRFNHAEGEKIVRAISETGLAKAEWARNVLLGATANDRITLRLRCPDCGNEVRKLPRDLKPGGATVCPKCGRTFIDQAVLKEAEAFAKFLEFCGA